MGKCAGVQTLFEITVFQICREVKVRIEQHIEKHRVNIDQQFKAVELKYMKLRVQTKLYHKVIPFSSANGKGKKYFFIYHLCLYFSILQYAVQFS